MNNITALAFALTLLVAVLLSGHAQRTLLSTSVVFLIAGIFSGPAFLNLGHVETWDSIESTLVELALVSVLFADGMHLNLHLPREEWRLPGQALLIGMPLTFVIITLAARLLFQLSWIESALLAAVLSPTDPLFASLIISKDVVPQRLRRFLNIESGLNDGLVLPIILILLQSMRDDPVHPLILIGQLVGGVLIGIAIPWIIIKLEELRLFSVEAIYQPLNAFAIGFLMLVVCEVTTANEFLAAFSAGATITTLSPAIRDAFEEFGEILTELLKGIALFIFGLLINSSLFVENGLLPYVFAVLVLLVARPIPILLILVRQPLSSLEKWTVAWFGPKGFSSIFYALLVASAPIAHRLELFQILTLTIILSIVVHSSTDVLFANRFEAEAIRRSD